MTIAPIETRYAGCRFRSRLEARWAVFFDDLAVAWEYEPQGFLVDGRPYLPDFLLKDCGTWVEVKGHATSVEHLLEAARNLPEMPYRLERGPRLLVLGSIPPPLARGDWGWIGFDSDGPHGELEFNRWGFGLYSKNSRPWLLCNTDDGSGGSPMLVGALPSAGECLAARLDETEPGAPWAYAAARSARFEHGERG